MKLLTTLSILLMLTLGAMATDEPMLEATPYAEVKEQLGKGAPYFLEVGSDSCQSCQLMGRQLYILVKEDPKLNIKFINVHKEYDAAKALKISMIPTQIIFDANGTEVFRHVGVLGSDEIPAI